MGRRSVRLSEVTERNVRADLLRAAAEDFELDSLVPRDGEAVLRKLIRQLKCECQVMFLLKHYNNYSHRSMAYFMNRLFNVKNEGVARQKYMHCRNELNRLARKLSP